MGHEQHMGSHRYGRGLQPWHRLRTLRDSGVYPLATQTRDRRMTKLAVVLVVIVVIVVACLMAEDDHPNGKGA